MPLGVADVKREGTDITIVTWSREVYFALEAAEELAKEGISAEVLDLRTLVPLDWDAIVKSVSKTTKLLLEEESVAVMLKFPHRLQRSCLMNWMHP